jgi:hypothetical protein
MGVNFLTLLQWVRKAVALLPLPEWTSAESARVWVLQKLVPLLEEVAETTSSDVDNKLVAGLQTLASNVDTWTTFYELVIDFVTLVDAGATVDAKHPMVQKLSDDTKIDPSVIIMLIQLAIQVIEWWKNRK